MHNPRIATPKVAEPQPKPEKLAVRRWRLDVSSAAVSSASCFDSMAWRERRGSCEPLDEGVQHAFDLVDLGVELLMMLWAQVAEIAGEDELVLRFTC